MSMTSPSAIVHQPLRVPHRGIPNLTMIFAGAGAGAAIVAVVVALFLAGTPEDVNAEVPQVPLAFPIGGADTGSSFSDRFLDAKRSAAVEPLPAQF